MKSIRAGATLFRRVMGGTLTIAECWLFVWVCLAQIVTFVGLRAKPIATVRRGTARLAPLARWIGGRPSEVRVVSALDASGRWLGGWSSCLRRALVAELFLSSAQRPLTTVIGIRRSSGGDFESHAWIERGGRVLVGGPTCDGYRPFLTWQSPRA